MGFIEANPIVEDPRDYFREAILNTTKILTDELQEGNNISKFGTPFLTRVNQGAYHRLPESWPTADVRFINMAQATRRTISHDGAMVMFPVNVSVRYFHSILDTHVNDLEVTKNLYRIFDILEYRNDLNGLCPRQRTSILGVTQEHSVFLEFASAGFIIGGAIVLEVPLIMHRQYFNSGMTERDVTFPSGP